MCFKHKYQTFIPKFLRGIKLYSFFVPVCSLTFPSVSVQICHKIFHPVHKWSDWTSYDKHKWSPTDHLCCHKWSTTNINIPGGHTIKYASQPRFYLVTLLVLILPWALLNTRLSRGSGSESWGLLDY